MTAVLAVRHHRLPPALTRLQSLAPLTERSATAVLDAVEHARTVPTRRELLTEGKPIAGPLLMLEGWAARVRILSDGRRQFIGFLLPGDLIGHCGFTGAVAGCTVVALTEVWVCALPDSAARADLARAYAISRAMDEAYLAAQITRLGRLDARERILDLLLELYERLALAGLTNRGGFTLPLTQEMLADAVGLTAVHVNRMVQLSRRLEDVQWNGREVRFGNPTAAARQCGHVRVSVT